MDPQKIKLIFVATSSFKSYDFCSICFLCFIDSDRISVVDFNCILFRRLGEEDERGGFRGGGGWKGGRGVHDLNAPASGHPAHDLDPPGPAGRGSRPTVTRSMGLAPLGRDDSGPRPRPRENRSPRLLLEGPHVGFRPGYRWEPAVQPANLL